MLIINKMSLVQLGINSTRDVWKFAKLDSPRRLVLTQPSFRIYRAKTCRSLGFHILSH